MQINVTICRQHTTQSVTLKNNSEAGFSTNTLQLEMKALQLRMQGLSIGFSCQILHLIYYWNTQISTYLETLKQTNCYFM